MSGLIEKEDWETCCRGRGCPQINITLNKENVPIVRIKDDYGDSVKMTKEQFDDIVATIPKLLISCNKNG